MSLELTAKLINILPVQNIQGKNGPLTKQEFIVETEEQYPKKVCVSAWNDTAKVIQGIKPQSLIKVGITVESREYNGRWYSEVKAWKIDLINGDKESNDNNQQYSSSSRTAETVSDPMQSESDGAADDLPF